MSDNTGIKWTDATWNPIVGCAIVSKGCTNCYAMRMAARIEKMAAHPMAAHVKVQTHYAGTTKSSKAGSVWTGKVAEAPAHILTQPLKWKRPRRVFVNSMGDLFAEGVHDEWIDKVFAVMALCPQHTFQVPTKRPERMRDYFAETWQPAPARNVTIGGETIRVEAEKRPGDRWDQINAAIDDLTINIGNKMFDQERFWTPEGALIGRPAWPRQPLPNVWLGVSAEDQATADERIPLLLETPAASRFVSAEPLLGPIDFTAIKRTVSPGYFGDVLQWYHQPHCDRDTVAYPKLDWIIVGGESGAGARPMHPQWARDIRDQCQAAGVAFFFKQWGAFADTHPDWPMATGIALANDGTVYRPGDLSYPDGARRDEALRANHDRAELTMMYPVGKARAGRLLDGREWNEFPAAAEKERLI